MPVNPRTPAILAILVTTLFWGISFSSTKVLLQSLVPEQIAFSRVLLAVLILSAVFFSTRQKMVRGGDLLRMGAGGLMGIFLYFLFENNGLRFTTAGTAALIVSIIPVLNVIAGALFFKERYLMRRWAGVLLSFIGVYLIIRYGSDGALSLANLKGNLLVFLAACSWVCFTRINETLSQKYSSISINFHQSLAGMLLLGLLVVPRGVDPAAFSPVVLYNLAFLGLFCSATAYFLYLYALKNLGSTTATTFLNLVPVFGVLGGAVILRETLAGGQIFGALTVILGVSLVTVSGKNKAPVPQPSSTA